ncbi:MAG: ROK family protein [Acidimicrobiia bacterium]
MARSVGVDVGGTKILALVFDDESGAVVGEPAKEATPPGTEALLDAVAAVVVRLEQAEGPVAGIGAGLPGLVDRRGRLAAAPNLPAVAGVAFAERLAERVGRQVTVDNDATCAAWAEATRGAAAGVADMVMVTLGTGIGAGLVAGGRLQRGRHGFAGEPGHMVVDPDGPLCPCGRRGCWERYASGSGLGRLAREAAEAGQAPRLVELAGGDPEAVKGEHVTAAAGQGDQDALAVLRQLGWWVALGLANLVNVLDPEVVVVGGGLVAAGEMLLGPVRSSFAELVLGPSHRPLTRIVPAALGSEAGAIGAALLALERRQ